MKPQTNEGRFQSLASISPVGIFQTDATGGFVYTNPQWQQMAGQSLEESLGEGWTHAVHPDDRDGLLSVWESAVRTGQEFSHEFRLLTRTGDVRAVSGRTKKIVSDDGTMSGYVGTLEDVTYRRQQKANLLRTTETPPEMLSLESTFVANMSHEVRTLMNVIIGMTDLALETTLSREQREYLESAKFSAYALLTVIDGILDCSKIET